jgi:hypothetical protein
MRCKLPEIDLQPSRAENGTGHPSYVCTFSFRTTNFPPSDKEIFRLVIPVETRDEIHGQHLEKILASFPPCYSQSLLLEMEFLDIILTKDSESFAPC